MTVLRVILFRLHESPRYLVAAGRPMEAMENLRLISRFNGEELDLNLRDVRDHFGTVRSSRRSLSLSAIPPIHRRPEEEEAFLPTTSSAIIFDADTDRNNETMKVSGGSLGSADYSATGETTTIRNNIYPFATPTIEAPEFSIANTPLHSSPQLHDYGHQRHYTDHSAAADEEDEPRVAPRSPRPRLSNTPRRSRSSVVSVSYKYMGWLPRPIRKPLWAYLDRIALVLSPEWIWKTLTISGIWFSMALGMFLCWKIVALTQSDVMGSIHDGQRVPTKVIREAAGRDAPRTISIKYESYRRNTVRRVVVEGQPTGCSDLLHRGVPWCNCECLKEKVSHRTQPHNTTLTKLGAYLVQSSLGRRWSLAGSAFLVAFFCVMFAKVDGPLLLRAGTAGFSLTATTMWAIVYSWVPDIFSTNVRGSACGIASALARMCVFLSFPPSQDN